MNPLTPEPRLIEGGGVTKEDKPHSEGQMPDTVLCSGHPVHAHKHSDYLSFL